MYQISSCSVRLRDSNQGHSGVSFKDQHVLTSAVHFVLGLEPKDREKVLKLMDENRLMTEKDFGQLTRVPGFLVTLQKEGILVQVPAQLRLMFSVRRARRAMQQVLGDLKPDSTLHKSEISSTFSSFLVLSLNEGAETKTEILTNVLLQVGSTATFGKMDPVHTLTTPFGSDVFFGTQNSGIISNIIEDSLMVLSVPLVQGCEGGGVFSRTNKLLGLIAASSFYWKMDNVTLTLAVRLDEIVSELIQLDQGIELDYVPPKSLPQRRHKGEDCVAMIDSGGSWGCGTLVTFRGKRFLITCSHVLEGATSLTVVWRSGKYTPEVIYKNPKANKAYDIALLSAPSDAPETCFAVLGKYKPARGSRVLNVGFPLISTTATRFFSPFIYNGTVTSYSPGLIITDSLVQAGQSGGPLFDSEWRLVGVCVSNMRDGVDNRVYPFINMVVPIRDIYRTLEKFLETGEISALDDLVAPEEIQRKWNLESPIFQAKL